MYRIIIYLFIIILQLLFGSNRRYRRYSFSRDGGDRMSELISMFFNRQRALKRCKNFLKKGKNFYNIKNQFVSIIFDDKQKVIKCYNAKNRKETTTVSLEQETYSANLMHEDLLYMFEEKINEICNYFNSETTYENIKKDLSLTFFSTKITTDESVKNNKNEQNLGIMEEVKSLIDINSASEKEITDLPGISIILAKKIIQYRDSNKGFKNLDEFYTKMKIKPHFIEKLDEMICVNEYLILENNNHENERILDF